MDADTIKKELDHPIVDGDGHLIEYLPLVRQFIAEEADESVARLFDDFVMSKADRAVAPEDRQTRRVTKKAWWGFPSENTLDRATAMLPNLFYHRLDEVGIDYALVYPTFGLYPSSIVNDDLRPAMARALNRYYSEVAFDHRDRLEPVASIPMRTPQEAIAELDFAVRDRGLKAIVMAGVIARPLAGAEGVPGAYWLDTVAHDSIYDYDPVWQRCVELNVAPTFHTLGSGWATRASTKNFVFNHIGHFAMAQEAACRAVVIGGVAHRFPELRFSFLEGGVAWAANLCSDLIGHFEKRNLDAVQTYDPEKLDRTQFGELLQQHGSPLVVKLSDQIEYALGSMHSDEKLTTAEMDEFAESGIKSADDITELFSHRFYFGCEADDPMTAVAFDPALPPVGRDLQPIFASDIGHYDVPDAREVLPEAYELVEHGQLNLEQFRKFTFSNAVSLLTAQNPEFFEGTVISDEVGALLKENAR